MGTYNCPIIKMFCRVQHSPNNFNKKISLRNSESNLKTLENQFEAGGFSDIKVQAMSSGNSSFELDMEKPNSFWRTFVLLAILFLLIEMALLKFWKS